MKPGKLIRTIDGQIIGEQNGWVLFIRAGKSTPQWTSLKLLRRSPGKARKNAFWLGWNGERLARNHDSILLADRHPGTHDWVISRLRENDHDL